MTAATTREPGQRRADKERPDASEPGPAPPRDVPGPRDAQGPPQRRALVPRDAVDCPAPRSRGVSMGARRWPGPGDHGRAGRALALRCRGIASAGAAARSGAFPALLQLGDGSGLGACRTWGVFPSLQTLA